MPQVVGTAAERRPALRGVSAALPGLGPHGGVGGVLEDAARAVDSPPSGVVPYLRIWARSRRTRGQGGIGTVRVSVAGRCLRPRSCRAVPWSVHTVQARDAEAARASRSLVIRRVTGAGTRQVHDR